MRRDALTAALEALDATALVDSERLAQELTARAADARALLGRHVAQTRQMVRRLLAGRLVCGPVDDHTGRGYRFTATGTYARLVPGIEPVNVGGGPTGFEPVFEQSQVSACATNYN